MIPDNYKPIRQLGNGSTVSFSFDFPLISENFIKVFRERNGVQSEVSRSEYTVSFDGQGGSVTFNTAPKKNDVIVVTRDIPLEQETPYKTSSGFPAVRVEDNFDKLTAITQQLNEIAGRCVKVNVTGDQTPEELLDEVYDKLDSATEVAEQAIGAANQATTAAKNANDAVIVAQQQITETQAFVNQARTDITSTANAAVSTINTTVDTAQANITSSIEEALDYVSQEAVNAATNVVADVVGQYTDRAETAATSAEANANKAEANAVSAEANAIKAETNATEVATYNFKNKITNCITEIPQNIKLELSNGTLTLKAGSKLYIPNGAGKFYEVIATTDCTMQNLPTTNGQYMLFDNGAFGTASLRYALTSKCASGATAPSDTSFVWYNTTQNLIQVYQSGAWTGARTLPLCIFTVSNGVISSIDQVFNGFGYIGSTVFALPNVKGLIPNGRNADGSLKNIEFTTSKVLTYSRSSAFTNYSLILKAADLATSGVSYDEENNFNLTSTGTNSGYAMVGKVSATTGGVITSFQPKLPFRAVDQNDFNKLDEEAVKTSGDQTIGGVKTFSDIIRRSSAFGGGGTSVIESADSNNKGLIALKPYYASNTIYNRLFAQNSTANKNAYVDISIKDAGTSNVQLYADTVIAPTPESNSNGTNIATTAWVNSNFKNNLIPNVGSKVDIVTAVSSTNGYTAPSSGFVSVQTNVNGTTTTLSVGGQVVAQAHQYSGDSHGSESKQLFALVGKGQVVKTSQAVQFGVFVPFK